MHRPITHRRNNNLKATPYVQNVVRKITIKVKHVRTVAINLHWTNISDLSIYIHVPFCAHICPYCAFYKLPWDAQLEPLYVSAIQNEIKSWVAKVGKAKVKTIFIGGGTPSMLSEEWLKQILKTLHDSFDCTNVIEKTCEMNPESVNPDTLSVLNFFGFNRISLGVQSFVESERKYLGRTHKNETVFAAVELLNKFGFSNFNIDLMFASKKTTLSGLSQSLAHAIKLNPAHISTYSLSIEDGTSFKKSGQAKLDPELDAEQFERIHNELCKNGYIHYEVSNFAKPGYECIHNLAYWQLTPYIGMGPSASSYVYPYVYQNPSDLHKYAEHPEINFTDDHFISLSEHETDYWMTNLRLKSGFNIQTFIDRFGTAKFDKHHARLEQLSNDGFLWINETTIGPTEKGMLHIDSILSHLGV